MLVEHEEKYDESSQNRVKHEQSVVFIIPGPTMWCDRSKKTREEEMLQKNVCCLTFVKIVCCAHTFKWFALLLDKSTRKFHSKEFQNNIHANDFCVPVAFIILMSQLE